MSIQVLTFWWKHMNDEHKIDIPRWSWLSLSFPQMWWTVEEKKYSKADLWKNEKKYKK